MVRTSQVLIVAVVKGHRCCCRIELCSQDGSVLHTILIDECTGGPHEFRGVYRGGLLRALQAGVPADSIQYSSAVSSVDQDEQGGSQIAWTYMHKCHVGTAE